MDLVQVQFGHVSCNQHIRAPQPGMAFINACFVFIKTDIKRAWYSFFPEQDLCSKGPGITFRFPECITIRKPEGRFYFSPVRECSGIG